MKTARVVSSNWRIRLLIVGCTLGGTGHVLGQDLHTYYGLLHAHTRFSDGSGTPEQAYAQAKAAGLDFFAITEHNHKDAESGAKERKDGLLIAADHKLYNATAPVLVDDNPALSIVQAARAATDAQFVGLYGQEFSTISSGNHVNVFEIEEVLTVPNGDFKGLYEQLNGVTVSDGQRPIVQLNHPDVHRDLFYPGHSKQIVKAMRNDYGIDDGDLGPGFEDLAQAGEGLVALIEVLSGPAMARQRDEHFRYDAHDDDLYFYLVQGLRVSPTAGQDNHYATWGTATDARTGVLCQALTRAQFLDALRQHRTFASEDRNLDVRLTANGLLMGSLLSLGADEPVRIEVAVRDGDEPDARYTVRLYHGLIAPQQRDAAREWKAADGLEETATRTGDGSVVFDGLTAAGAAEFFYVQVEESDRDRAWSAPVWINHPVSGGEFVWSTSSRAQYYHRPDCPVARRIVHRQSGSTPPAQLKPHNCVADDDEAEEEES